MHAFTHIISPSKKKRGVGERNYEERDTAPFLPATRKKYPATHEERHKQPAISYTRGEVEKFFAQKFLTNERPEFIKRVQEISPELVFRRVIAEARIFKDPRGIFSR